MDTRQLMTFTTLAETLNYQRAAERLQYAPSSLFRHVQQLEEELGATLFFKNGRQLELTATGQRLLPDAKRLLAGYQDFLTAARQSETDQALALGGCEMNTSYSLMELLQQFTAQFPDIALQYDHFTECCGTGSAARRHHRYRFLLQYLIASPAGPCARSPVSGGSPSVCRPFQPVA